MTQVPVVPKQPDDVEDSDLYPELQLHMIGCDELPEQRNPGEHARQVPLVPVHPVEVVELE
jgi:hypothetical protein